MFSSDSCSDGSFGRVDRAFVKNGSYATANGPCVALGCGRVVLEFKGEHLARPNGFPLECFLNECPDV